MTFSRKDVRRVVGLTFDAVGADSGNWIQRAKEFRVAAELIANASENAPPMPFYLNAALSLELLLKAIAVARATELRFTHRLNELCGLVGVQISPDQVATLEFLSEVIVWSGRYPVPKDERSWDNYYDHVLEKHVVRDGEGSLGRTRANTRTFPTLENYLSLWTNLSDAYNASVGNGA